MIYTTAYGKMYTGNCQDILRNNLDALKGKVNLIFTSPPFPLNRAKKYGNMTGDEYLEWIANLATFLKDYLAPDGSIVIELGNAWNSGIPTHSTLPTLFPSLTAFIHQLRFRIFGGTKSVFECIFVCASI